MKKMNKSMKRLVIVVGSLVIFAAVGFGVMIALSLTHPAQTVTIPNDIPLKDTPDYGACHLITTDGIRHATFANLIKDVSEGVRTGVKGLDGEAADACSYAYTTEVSSHNVLTIAVYRYPVGAPTNSQPSSGSIWSEISGTQPRMYFSDGKLDNGATTVYLLRQAVGADVILLTMRQPTNASGFQRVEATWFLVSIAKGANTSNLTAPSSASQPKSSTSSGTSSNAPSPSDTPPPPPSNTVNDVGH